jgi:hypothetical protein
MKTIYSVYADVFIAFGVKDEILLVSFEGEFGGDAAENLISIIKNFITEKCIPYAKEKLKTSINDLTFGDILNNAELMSELRGYLKDFGNDCVNNIIDSFYKKQVLCSTKAFRIKETPLYNSIGC